MIDIDIPFMTKITQSLKINWVKDTMSANLFEYKKSSNANKEKIAEVEKMINLLSEAEYYHQQLWEVGMVASKHEYHTMKENLNLREKIKDLETQIKMLKQL